MCRVIEGGMDDHIAKLLVILTTKLANASLIPVSGKYLYNHISPLVLFKVQIDNKNMGRMYFMKHKLFSV